jgi:hypothetical protein
VVVIGTALAALPYSGHECVGFLHRIGRVPLDVEIIEATTRRLPRAGIDTEQLDTSPTKLEMAR